MVKTKQAEKQTENKCINTNLFGGFKANNNIQNKMTSIFHSTIRYTKNKIDEYTKNKLDEESEDLTMLKDDIESEDLTMLENDEKSEDLKNLEDDEIFIKKGLDLLSPSDTATHHFNNEMNNN